MRREQHQSRGQLHALPVAKRRRAARRAPDCRSGRDSEQQTTNRQGSRSAALLPCLRSRYGECCPRVSESAAVGASEVLELPEVLVVTLAFARQQAVNGVVVIIAPDRVEAIPALLASAGSSRASFWSLSAIK